MAKVDALFHFPASHGTRQSQLHARFTSEHPVSRTVSNRLRFNSPSNFFRSEINLSQFFFCGVPVSTKEAGESLINVVAPVRNRSRRDRWDKTFADEIAASYLASRPNSIDALHYYYSQTVLRLFDFEKRGRLSNLVKRPSDASLFLSATDAAVFQLFQRRRVMFSTVRCEKNAADTV